MCGIAGEFRFDNTPPDVAGMDRMLAKLARRGPDAEGQHADGAVRLGYRRLAIIDLSSCSNPVVTHSPRISCHCEECSYAAYDSTWASAHSGSESFRAIQKGQLNQSAGLLIFARNDRQPWLWVTTG
jgi:hypothetical protein